MHFVSKFHLCWLLLYLKELFLVTSLIHSKAKFPFLYFCFFQIVSDSWRFQEPIRYGLFLLTHFLRFSQMGLCSFTLICESSWEIHGLNKGLALQSFISFLLFFLLFILNQYVMNTLFCTGFCYCLRYLLIFTHRLSWTFFSEKMISFVDCSGYWNWVGKSCSSS